MLVRMAENNTNICYLAATPDNSDYINGCCVWVVDEIILYTVPFISGTGNFFQVGTYLKNAGHFPRKELFQRSMLSIYTRALESEK